MSLDNLADLAEIISSMAVVVTLIFLVVQLHANTKALRMNAISTHYTDGMELVADGVRIPEMATTAQKVFANQPLDAMDKYYLNNWVIRTCYLMERHLLDMRDGLLDPSTFDRSILSGKTLLRTPAGRASYEALKQGNAFGPEVSEYIDEFLQKLDSEAEIRAAQ